MRLARKVNLSKWRQHETAGIDCIPADAITNDLKTFGNTLSFWRVKEDAEGLDNAMLAILGSQERIDKLDIAIIPANFMADDRLLVDTPGKTCFTSLETLHVDLSFLNSEHLAAVARALAACVYNNQTTKVARADFTSRIKAGISLHKVPPSQVSESVRKELKLV
ncbi:MAG: hypothetical protein EOO32_00240 [Comamonadaceae bacterium]|nr:MAG: hypothetical protein EOO32_00240 [Comamonadaceae bacterium]